MSSQSFRRHARRGGDLATHLAFASLDPAAHELFSRLLAVARRGFSPGPVGPAALRNLARHASALLRAPEEWRPVAGHPLHVVASLAAHLYGRHPVPRFLASVWLGDDDAAAHERRGWYLAHAGGAPFRRLPLPLPLTRRMEHLFLASADHLTVTEALRRAEVLALGGTPALVELLLATRLGAELVDAAFWRRTIEWLVRWEAALDPAHVGAIVDYQRAARRELRGRTPRSLLREVAAWHGGLASGSARLRWEASPLAGFELEVGAPDAQGRRAQWSCVQLTDSAQLALEGRAMHHCVGSFVAACSNGSAAIFSLRRRLGADGPAKVVLTIQVRPSKGEIVQLRGPFNRWAGGLPLQLVRAWAAHAQLSFGPWALPAEAVAA